MIHKILLIGAGGFIGSVARYFLSRLNLTIDFFSIPVGTLVVNITGSLLIGFLIGFADKSNLLTENWRLFLMVGLCGGFTTFSSFTGENLVMLHSAQYLSVILYTTLSIFLGFLAVYLGFVSTNLL